MACSGPGAGAAIAFATQFGYWCAYLGGGLLILSLLLSATRFRSWVCPCILGFFLLIHPAWTVSAAIGDCGELRKMTSSLVSFIGGCTITAQILIGLHRSAARPSVDESVAAEE